VLNYRWSGSYDRPSTRPQIHGQDAGNKEEPAMKYIKGKKGFTLVELMIVIAIVAILVALALPSYGAYIRKAKRGEAEQLLMNWANMQEIWRANNPTYADEGDIAVPTHDEYTFTVTGETASTYILTADPTGDQVYDKDKGKDCDPLTLNESGTKGPVHSSVTYCWGD
jgi:type IV pilus assembly protein PilE